MKIVKVNDDFIEYLNKIDKKVSLNKQEKRPYIGICFSINDYDYFAPLTSPKSKHKKMKNNLDFHKIKNGDLGCINLNNMIPVSKNEIINFNIKSSPDYFLLSKQLNYINSDRKIILSKAKKLYSKITEIENSYFHSRSCNFKLLEKAKDLYKETLLNGVDVYQVFLLNQSKDNLDIIKDLIEDIKNNSNTSDDKINIMLEIAEVNFILEKKKEHNR
ncbi:MAG: type III toxin-antitoxin system ToxN/AbiQ family toxin [Fusobacteriaceae bacterium]|nr:type III toxin-antitoxin system ToxN/AbiQ family toxin [Fusobacteriaceae bacterium]MBP6713841.1 type III toxin-antitoxin system ToxN/AbiQ family toxin [Aliarcobacter sp.]MBU9918692.1 type III toxin-antitoxin system ToxN/AbiQ family toxin [Fusobacteriaceae bacterium]